LIANPIFEKFLFDFFYKGCVMVFVEKSNKSVERHYYRISEDHKLLIYPDITKDSYVMNPSIEGSGICYDSESKVAMLSWKEGDKFAYPLLSKDYSRKIITSDNDLKTYNLGRKIERYNNPNELKKKDSMDFVLIAMFLCIGACIINLIFSYMIAEKLGIKVFG
jgi:hypothetical protein